MQMTILSIFFFKELKANRAASTTDGNRPKIPESFKY